MGKIITVTNGQQNENELMHDIGGSARWRRECLEMDEAGIYDEVAAIIGEKRYALLLDICCGFCPLERRLATSHPSAHYVGVDINTETLQTAKQDLFQGGVRSHVYRARTGNTVIADADVLTQGSIYQKSWEELRGQILLIEGDVARAADTVLEATGGTLADISMNTFMGFSHKLCGREPTTDGTDLQVKAMMSPMELATRLTKTNGTYVTAQRAVQPRNQPMSATLKKVEELNHILFGSFWNMEKKPEALHTDIESIRTAGTPAFSDRVRKTGYILEAKRTKKKPNDAEFADIQRQISELIAEENAEF